MRSKRRFKRFGSRASCDECFLGLLPVIMLRNCSAFETKASFGGVGGNRWRCDNLLSRTTPRQGRTPFSGPLRGRERPGCFGRGSSTASSAQVQCSMRPIRARECLTGVWRLGSTGGSEGHCEAAACVARACTQCDQSKDSRDSEAGILVKRVSWAHCVSY
jgi:hypothetical protein